MFGFIWMVSVMQLNKLVLKYIPETWEFWSLWAAGNRPLEVTNPSICLCDCVIPISKHQIPWDELLYHM